MQGLERLRLSISPDALMQITLLSQGLPHYAHLLALHSVRIAAELSQVGPVSHLRMSIYPDGGVSRLRVYGRPVQS